MYLESCAPVVVHIKTPAMHKAKAHNRHMQRKHDIVYIHTECALYTIKLMFPD